MTFEKPPTVRLDPRIARELGLSPTRILKRDGVYEKEYDVPFLGFVDGSDFAKVRLMIFGHGPKVFSASEVRGLTKAHREDKLKPKAAAKRDDKQIDLEDWLSAKVDQ